MCNKTRCLANRISVSELRQQLEYAQTIGSDLFDIFSQRTPDKDLLLDEYPAISLKISMILDFLFQAKLWCDVLSGRSGKGSEEPIAE